MLLGKADTLVVERARNAAADAVAPILDAMSQPVSTVNDVILQARELAALRAENARLRRENDRLMHWQTVATRMEEENEALRGLLNLAPDPTRRFVSARVIADQGGAFVRSVLINAGSREGVKRGQAALSVEGLAGRVAQVGQRSARILLITDMNSRVPVLVGQSRHRAVVAGDNSNQPGLLFLGPRVQVAVGDPIVTSGHGGVLPPGIPVGVVATVDERGVRVQPYADWHHMEFLRVVDYEMPGLLLPADGKQ